MNTYELLPKIQFRSEDNGTTKLSAIIHGHILKAKRCYAARGRVPCKCFEAHVCELYLLNTLWFKKKFHLRTQQKTKCGRPNFGEEATVEMWYMVYRLENDRNVRLKPYRICWTVSWDVPTVEVSIRTLNKEFRSTDCSRSFSSMAARIHLFNCTVVVKNPNFGRI